MVSITLYSQESNNKQAQALKSNNIKTVKKFLLKSPSNKTKMDSILVSIRSVNAQGYETYENYYDTLGRTIMERTVTYINDTLISESKTTNPEFRITYDYMDYNRLKTEKTYLSGRMSSIKNYYYNTENVLEKTEQYFLKPKNSNQKNSFERKTYTFDPVNDIITIKEEKTTHKKNELIESTIIKRWSQDKRTQSIWVTDRMSPKWFMTEKNIFFKEELRDTQEFFYRTNAFMNQDGFRISLSKGDKLLTENHYHSNGLIKETKMFRNSELLATFVYQYFP